MTTELNLYLAGPMTVNRYEFSDWAASCATTATTWCPAENDDPSTVGCVRLVVGRRSGSAGQLRREADDDSHQADHVV